MPLFLVYCGDYFFLFHSYLNKKTNTHIIIRLIVHVSANILNIFYRKLNSYRIKKKLQICWIFLKMKDKEFTCDKNYADLFIIYHVTINLENKISKIPKKDTDIALISSKMV